ncbi:hypothetical protein [Sphingopyxis macrogoltabida]|uniref:Uncharacterized protein n=1 Tax=Sphingopyxis macrogoltabida TaxID=33050 RepID=A0AAC8YY81_SPHMC|nr:hypothetical protein [Sphingopyxis macrogoltabida]ALJ12205.1 hypothetical protein LH19_04930 [Sphingopyxis macrogoltabida]AMU88379.1 hypothetical protein ATM17_04890 [Sphingopyxis macrogoltabida]
METLSEKSEIETEGDETADQDEAATARRAALKKIGIIGAYTAPAMILLLKPVKAHAVSDEWGFPM